MANDSAWNGIEKLRGSENYHTWQFSIKNLLELNEYSKCIKTGTNAETDETKKRKAKARIELSISPSLFVHVASSTSAAETWKKLKDLFEDRGLSRRISLLRKLVTISLESCDSMNDYISQAIETANKLNGIGFSVPDEWLGSILLAGLPNDFAPMIMGLESSGTTITADSIKSKLLDCGYGSKSDGQGSAFFGNNGSCNKSRSSSKLNVKCFNCGKRGHMSKDCRSPKSENKSQPQYNKNNKNKGPQAKAVFLSTVQDPDQITSAAYFSKQCHESEWYIDSGASQHMSPFENLFTEIKSSEITQITSANSSKIPVKGVGKIQVRVNEFEIDFINVLYVPGLSANLLSVAQMIKNGNEVIFSQNGCRIINKLKQLVCDIKSDNGVYRLQVQQVKCLASMTQTKSGLLWHRKLGHINFADMCKMKNGLVNGINFDNKNEIEIKNCVICKEGKQTRKSFTNSTTRTDNILDLVHSDLMGPMENKSVGGAKFILTFIDDHSRKIFVFFLKEKSEVFDRFIEFQAVVEKETGRKIKALRSDNGTEYINQKFKKYFKINGIKHQTSVVYTPEQNGIAERTNRKLVEKAKCMLFDSKLDVSFWAEAINMATYILNRSANATLNTITPEEVWSGIKVDVSHLQVFGSPVMVHIPKQKRKKWDKKSKKLVFVGFSEGTKGYRCVDPISKKLDISRDVVFLNESVSDQVVVTEDSADLELKEVPNEVRDDEQRVPAVNNELVTSTPAKPSSEPIENELEETLVSSDSSIETIYDDANDVTYEHKGSITPQQTVRRTSRAPKPRKFDDYVTYGAFGLLAQVDEPITYNEALNNESCEQWKSAMQEEVNSLVENGTWQLVDLPENRKPIKSKWVFKLKRDESGNITRFKARLVAKGCSQVYGIDYEEVYSPVVRYSSIRFVLALAVKNCLKIDQMDAITAFLQGDLNEDIYMVQPEGFHDGTNKVCKLNKAIYGLKQSGRVWNEKLTKMLRSYGLKKSISDPCVFFNDDLSLIITIYVDDFLIFWKNQVTLNKLKEALCNAFKMKDVGIASTCIGLHITYENNGIAIDQKSYISEVIGRFGMGNSNPVATPSDPCQKLSVAMCPTTEDEKEEMTKFPYQSLVGCLLFIAQGSRPDIAYAVNDVSRFNSKYGRPHWTAVKKILRYLKGTLDYKLRYSKSDIKHLTGYCDSDWASDVDKRRSCTGYVFQLSNGAITWNSKRQNTIALSSTEAEYMAVSWAVREAIWLQNFGRELDPDIAQPVHIQMDNQSAIDLSKSDGYNQRTKHIDVRYHHLRQKIEDGTINLTYVSTDENAADVLTKAVSGPKTKLCSIKMGLN